MDRVSSLIFPGSKTIAGWWRQLLPYHAQAIWIGYGYLHRVEAPVFTRRQRPVDPFLHLILQAIALETSSHGARAELNSLQERLHLPAVVVLRVIMDLQAIGFLERADGDGWQMTATGARALDQRQYTLAAQERRTFAFLERIDATGERCAPAHFVRLAECVHVPWQVDERHRFDPAWLQAAIDQPADWKAAHGFPADVEAAAAGPPSDDGQYVVLDRAERSLLVLIRAGNPESAELLAFAVKIHDWTLFDREPVLRLPIGACELWPEVEQSPSDVVWLEAWRNWCRERQLPASEVETCSVNYRAPRLEVQAPARLVQRLQSAKSDLFRGEAWILVGNGYTRAAAQLFVRV